MKNPQHSKSQLFMQRYKFANIQWHKDQAFSIDSLDYYASTNGRKGEFEHVFNRGNHLQEKFQKLQPNMHKNISADDFSIGEIGFGLGLNFLLTVELFLLQASNHCTLAYYSAEWLMPPTKDIQQAWQSIGVKEPNITVFLNALTQPMRPGWNELTWQYDTKKIMLRLWIGSAYEMCEDIAKHKTPMQIDAWYLDGFSIQTNPQAWQSELMGQLIACSHSQTSYATFSSHPQLIKNLEEHHANPVKLPGFENKRTFVSGNFSVPRPAKSAPPATRNQHIKIIGSGIAGAIIARKLAESSNTITIIGLPATKHLPTGIVHPQLSPVDSNLSKQRWDAWHLTAEWLRHHPLQWLDNSVVQIFNSPKAMRKMQRLLTIPFIAQQLVSLPTPQTDYTAAQIKHCGSGSIAHYITSLLDHPNITALDGHYDSWVDLDCEHTIITTATILTPSSRAALGISLQNRVCASFMVNKTIDTAIVGRNWLSSNCTNVSQPAIWIGTEDGNLTQDEVTQSLIEKSHPLIAQYNALKQDNLTITDYSAIELFSGVKTSSLTNTPICMKINDQQQDLIPATLRPQSNQSCYLNIAMGSRGIINACWAAHQISNMLLPNK